MADSSTDMWSFKYYLSAYISAARTRTLALQQFNTIPGFKEWYAPHQETLRASRLAKFFLDTRNAHVHGGPYPVASGRFHHGVARYYFARSPSGADDLCDADVVTLCREYLVLLLEITYGCYVQLGRHIDPQQYFTKEHFSRLGRSINDAEMEVWGWVMQSYIDEGYADQIGVDAVYRGGEHSRQHE